MAAEPRQSTVLFWGRGSRVPSVPFAATGDEQRSALPGGQTALDPAGSRVPAATLADGQQPVLLLNFGKGFLFERLLDLQGMAGYMTGPFKKALPVIDLDIRDMP